MRTSSSSASSQYWDCLSKGRKSCYQQGLCPWYTSKDSLVRRTNREQYLVLLDPDSVLSGGDCKLSVVSPSTQRVNLTVDWQCSDGYICCSTERGNPWIASPFYGFLQVICHANKWNESGFRPPLCTYRLNWARRTSWGWWDDWDDTVLQTQDSKFEPWRSEAEHATSRSRRFPTILSFTRG